MKYLTVEDVLLLHYLAVEKSGGSHGLRDTSLLESAINRPRATFGKTDLYPTLFDKAGALCHSLVKNHPFVDGNKRTALFAAMVTIERNGYTFLCSQKDLVTIGVAIDTENITSEEISLWLKKHSKRKQKR